MSQTRKNKLFYRLLHAVKDEAGKRPRWTLDKIADEIYVNRSHLNDVINNKAGHGAQTRPKLVKFFKKHFEQWRGILSALRWDEEGRIVPHGTSDVQHSEPSETEVENG